MAAPFGNHPTLFEYIAWCNSQGCTTQSGMVYDGETTVTSQILKAPNGRHVIVSGIAMGERLLPTQVAYLDRRLGLVSPYGRSSGTVH
jgi:hypothetical protein